MKEMNFDKALENFRAGSEQIARDYFIRNNFTFAVPHVETGTGKKYIKLWKGEVWPGDEVYRRTSIFAFVEVSTGDIFKPASTKAPAKHSRGNIYAENFGGAVTAAGAIRYMR